MTADSGRIVVIDRIRSYRIWVAFMLVCAAVCTWRLHVVANEPEVVEVLAKPSFISIFPPSESTNIAILGATDVPDGNASPLVLMDRGKEIAHVDLDGTWHPRSDVHTCPKTKVKE